MGHYPAIKDFIQQKAGAVKNLEVTYTQGAPPNLYMKDSSGSIVDEVRFAHHRNGIRPLSHREKGVRAYPPCGRTGLDARVGRRGHENPQGHDDSHR